MDTANSIVEYYGSIDSSEFALDRDAKLRDALERELKDNAVSLEEALPKVRGEWRLPLAALITTMLLSGLGLAISLVKYNVEMETLFFRPTPFFNTEASLVEALRKRSDMEISKRDRLIAEYRRRAILRGEVQTALTATVASAPERPPKAIEDVAPQLGEMKILDEMGRQAEVEALYVRRLEQALVKASRQADDGDLAGAGETMALLRASLLQKESMDSPVVNAALAISAAVSSVLAAAEASPASAVPIASAEPPAMASAENPVYAAALKRLRTENAALLDRIAALEARRGAAPRRTAPAVAGPSGAFIGTVALSNGNRVLVDLAQGAEPRVGDLVEIYGTDESGAATLLATGSLTAVRGGTVQITVSDRNGPLRVRDTAYLVHRDR